MGEHLSKIVRRDLPSCSRVRELLDYDPRTGALVWRSTVRGTKIRAGRMAGRYRPDGQFLIGIDGVTYRGHRVIWVWMTGCEPPDYIDHEDMSRRNNRWDNLREADNSLNMANRGTQANKKTNTLKGAYLMWNGTWYSRIQKDGQDYLLGVHPSAELAHAAYATKARELFGKFARAS